MVLDVSAPQLVLRKSVRDINGLYVQHLIQDVQVYLEGLYRMHHVSVVKRCMTVHMVPEGFVVSIVREELLPLGNGRKVDPKRVDVWMLSSQLC